MRKIFYVITDRKEILFGQEAKKYMEEYGPEAIEKYEKETGTTGHPKYIVNHGYIENGVYGLPELVEYALVAAKR